MTAKKSITNKAGFTLLEILVSMAILAIVLSTLYAVFTKTLAEMSQVESEGDIYQMARITLLRMQEDLECSLLLKTQETPEDTENASGTVGFEGKNEEIDGRDADSLTFFSTKHIRPDQEVEYPGPTRISFYVTENDEQEGFTLYRSDTPGYEDTPEEGTGGLILCDNLFSVNFTYYSAEGDEYEEWYPEEESSEGKLPAMVSIELSFINASNPEEPLKFETGVALPMARDKYGEDS